MPDNKHLTKSELLEVIKDLGIATKSDLREIISEEVASKSLVSKGELQKIISKEIAGSERRIKRRMGKEHNEIKTRIAKVATTTPTYKEFKELKEKMGHAHPHN